MKKNIKSFFTENGELTVGIGEQYNEDINGRSFDKHIITIYMTDESNDRDAVTLMDEMQAIKLIGALSEALITLNQTPNTL